MHWRFVMMAIPNKGAIAYYLGAVGIMSMGTVLAASAYPEHFDWMYTVVSSLASRKHNPEGSRWFAAALSLAMALLWPVVQSLRDSSPSRDRAAALGVIALRIGIVFGCLVGLERFFLFHLSARLAKGHEVIALVCFLALFTGVLAMYRSRSRVDRRFRWPARLVVVPLIAIGVSQLALYLGQRNLGWVDAGWRELGIALWYSFAFWQWLAFATLWLAIGHLVLTVREARDVTW